MVMSHHGGVGRVSAMPPTDWHCHSHCLKRYCAGLENPEPEGAGVSCLQPNVPRPAWKTTSENIVWSPSGTSYEFVHDPLVR
jgi:hypothetical protein